MTGATTVTRTFTTDEAGAIVKMTVATTPSAGADDGTYLVTYKGHGDAIGLAEIHPTTGALTQAARIAYSTWGTPTVTSVNGYGTLGFRYLYVGRFDVQWDDFASAGLHYMHARNYSPEFGRFLQPDPSALEANLYGYAENGPVSKVDPDGTLPFLAFVVVVARVAAVVTPLVARWATMVGTKLVAGAIAAGPAVRRAGDAITVTWQRFTNWLNANLLTWFGNRTFPATGSALKTDLYHNFPVLLDRYIRHGRVFTLDSGAKLVQIEGHLNGYPGRYEWIIKAGQVTHRLFVKYGRINGRPIDP